MYFSTACEWLTWIETLHSSEMDLSLERVKIVADRLGLLTPNAMVITIGGTNGKGSTVAGLESIYRAAGYTTGAFTTPFLFRYNEQVRINGQSPDDAQFCAVFARVADALGEVTITPFEFMTLSALLLFKEAQLDVWLLEVGLGGRLDAVNIIDADLSIVTSIGIDHVQWLGETREAIAIEKAGIFRKGKPAVCGDPEPPYTLLAEAKNKEANLFRLGVDYFYKQTSPKTWQWRFAEAHYEHLPVNTLALQNMANVLMGIHLMQNKLPVSEDSIMQGLPQVKLPGRLETKMGAVLEIHDVSHNPAAVLWLADHLQQLPCKGKTLAVFSMLADKDISSSLEAIKNEISEWYVAPLTTKRAASKTMLETAFIKTQINQVNYFANIKEAYAAAKQHAQSQDRIIVFGSCHTLAEIN